VLSFDVNGDSATPSGPNSLAGRVRRVDVGEHLHALVLGDAAEEHAVGARRLDLRGERAEVRGLRVDAVVAEDLQALGLADVATWSAMPFP
jgi:hypothetical protein